MYNLTLTAVNKGYFVAPLLVNGVCLCCYLAVNIGKLIKAYSVI